MKILLFLCTICYVHCNLLLSQVNAEIVGGKSNNLSTASTTTTEIPSVDLSESETEDVTSTYIGETIDGQVLTDEPEAPDELKTDTVQESNDELTLKTEQEASDQQETATENIQGEATEILDKHVVQSNAGEPETPIERNNGTEAEEVRSETKGDAEVEIPADQKSSTEATIRSEEQADAKPETPVETDKSTGEAADDKPKTVANPEVPIEQTVDKVNTDDKTVTDTNPEIPVEQKADSESDSKVEMKDNPTEEVPEGITNTDDKIEHTSETKISIEEKADTDDESTKIKSPIVGKTDTDKAPTNIQEDDTETGTEKTELEKKDNTKSETPDEPEKIVEDEPKTEDPVETKTSTDEAADDKPKTVANPEVPIEQTVDKVNTDDKTVTDANPEIPVEQKADSEAETKMETKVDTEENPENDDKIEDTAETKIPIEEKNDEPTKTESPTEEKADVDEKSTSKQEDDIETNTEKAELDRKNNTKSETLDEPEVPGETLVEDEIKTIEKLDALPEEKTDNVDEEANVETKPNTEAKVNEELKSETSADKKTKTSAEEKTETSAEEKTKTSAKEKSEIVEGKKDINEAKQDQKSSTETESTTETPTKAESVEDDEVESKYISDPSDITIEHIDFVQLRLSHIAKKTTSNITEIRLLQAKEFEKNEVYKEGWAKAVGLFDDQKKKKIFKGFSKKSAVRTVPDEYHIALIAYTLAYPGVYADFNKKTREVCSGKDVDAYDYQSYFKLLLLAIEYLGQEMKFRSGNRFLYRGVSSKFALEVGQVLAFQHFQSTSSSLMIAEDFAGKTLFEIQGKFNTAVSIRDHSRFRHEDEVLFSPFQVYKVESKHEGKYYTRYVLIAHDLPWSSTCDLDLRPATPAPQQLGLADKNGATLKRSPNSEHFAGSNRVAATSIISLISLCAIFTSFVF